MNINIVSTPKLDPTSLADYPRWKACVYISTTKKGWEPATVWEGDFSYESETAAEDAGFERIAILLTAGCND